MLCCLSTVVLTFVVVEFETNWWFLEEPDDGSNNKASVSPTKMLKYIPGTTIKLKHILFGMKVMIVFTNIWTFIFNTHYHVLKLYLELARSRISDDRMLTVWQVPDAKMRVLLEGAFIMISPIPGFQTSTRMFVGLSKHDPFAEFQMDVFIYIVMLIMRWKFVYRFIYVRQDLFTQDGMVLSQLTGTKATPSLGFRAFTEQNPVSLFMGSLATYLMLVAYVHNKLEGPTNYWPEERFRGEAVDDDTRLIKDGYYPVTFMNALWMHFIAFSTIGFGEYLVETMFGRILVAVSFFAGLVLTSFAINILFKKLAIETSEQFLLEKLQVKKMRKVFAQSALNVIQRLVRRFLLACELKMIRSGGSGRTFTTSKNFTSNGFKVGMSMGVNMKNQKKGMTKGGVGVQSQKQNRMRLRRGTLFSEDEEIELKQRMVTAANTALNLGLFEWRSVRQEFNKLEVSAFDTEKGLNDVDTRTSNMERMIQDLYTDMALVSKALHIKKSICASLDPKPYINKNSSYGGLMESIKKPTSLADAVRMAARNADILSEEVESPEEHGYEDHMAHYDVLKNKTYYDNPSEPEPEPEPEHEPAYTEYTEYTKNPMRGQERPPRNSATSVASANFSEDAQSQEARRSSTTPPPFHAEEADEAWKMI